MEIRRFPRIQDIFNMLVRTPGDGKGALVKGLPVALKPNWELLIGKAITEPSLLIAVGLIEF